MKKWFICFVFVNLIIGNKINKGQNWFSIVIIVPLHNLYSNLIGKQKIWAKYNVFLNVQSMNQKVNLFHNIKFNIKSKNNIYPK